MQMYLVLTLFLFYHHRGAYWSQNAPTLFQKKRNCNLLEWFVHNRQLILQELALPPHFCFFRSRHFPGVLEIRGKGKGPTWSFSSFSAFSTLDSMNLLSSLWATKSHFGWTLKTAPARVWMKGNWLKNLTEEINLQWFVVLSSVDRANSWSC